MPGAPQGWPEPSAQVAVAVDVVIPSWNGVAVLRRCLDALAAQEHPPARIIVVDNGSSDGSDREAAGRPGVEVVQLGANTGFGHAANVGVARANAPYVCVLNSDTRPAPRWLRELATAIATADASTWAWGSVLVRPTGVIESAGDEYSPSGQAFKRWRDRPLADLPDAPYEVFATPGAALTCRRDVFLTLGGYAEHFFLYYEDIDLAARARLQGHRAVVVPTARMEHALGASGTKDTVWFHVARNKAWTARRTRPDGSWGFVARLLVAEVLEARRNHHLRPSLRGTVASVRGLRRADADRRALQADRSPHETLTTSLTRPESWDGPTR